MLSHGCGSIDAFLGASLKGQSVLWPAGWDDGANCDRVLERLVYHGIAAVLVDRKEQLESWPDPLAAALRERATAQAIWELRHRVILGDLLDALAKADIPTLLLKGTALAYDVYDNPASRARGDSDILVRDLDVDWARDVLRSTGFVLSPGESGAHDRFKLQESWSVDAGDGSTHAVDLHWQTLNSPALKDVLSWQACFEGAAPLPRLAATALRPNRAAQLLHACTHQAMHRTAPYFVDGATHFGGDRLIWARDIQLLSGVFSDLEWNAACAMAEEAGLAPTCLRALSQAVDRLDAPVPAPVLDRLGRATGSTSSAYLEAGNLKRAVIDWRAVGGLAERLRYARARLFPPEAFMRAKYPRMARLPLAILHARRSLGLFRSMKRATGSRKVAP